MLADLRRTHERLLAVVAALPEGDLERLATHFSQKNWRMIRTRSPAGSSTSATSTRGSASTGSCVLPAAADPRRRADPNHGDRGVGSKRRAVAPRGKHPARVPVPPR